MNILLIEDDTNKAAQLMAFLQDNFVNDNFRHNRSYQSGMKSLMSEPFHLVILDMSLPNFDIKTGEDGYKFRKLGGQDVLTEIKRKKIKTKVIIVTQFESFGEGNDLIDLASLRIKLSELFKNLYKGTVYYNASQDDWKNSLKQIVTKLKAEYGEDTNR